MIEKRQSPAHFCLPTQQQVNHKTLEYLNLQDALYGFTLIIRQIPPWCKQNDKQKSSFEHRAQVFVSEEESTGADTNRWIDKQCPTITSFLF